MRAHEFIKPLLLEYDRNTTARNLSTNLRRELVTRFTRGFIEDREIYDHFYRSDIRTHNSYNKLPPEQKEQLKDKYQSMLRLSTLDNTVTPEGDLPLSDMVLTNTVLMAIENSTNRATIKYVPYILREYIRGNISRFEDIGGAAEVLEKYDSYKKLRGFPPEYKDINKVNFRTLRDAVRKFKPDDPYGYSENLGDYDVVYGKINVRKDENGNIVADIMSDVVIIHPKNETAGIYFGRVFGGFAEWCTAYVPPRTNMFDYYNRQGPMYIIVPRNPESENEKYQLHGESNQYKDKNDDDVDIGNLLNDRFPEIRETVLKLVPKIKSLISFADPEIVTGIWKKIGEYTTDMIFDKVSDTESYDDYYHEYVFKSAVDNELWVKDIDPERLADIKNGDIKPELDDVDMDMAYSKNDYLEYNYELGTMVKLYKSFIDSSYREILEYNDKWLYDYDSQPVVQKLTDVYAHALKKDRDFDNYLDDIVKYVEYSMDISYSKEYSYGTSDPKNWVRIGEVGPYILYRKKRKHEN